MATCISSLCRRQIDDGWPFCTYCGADNRPPGQRSDHPCPRHDVPPSGTYCVLCGETPTEPFAIRGVARRRWSGVLIVAGILILLVITYLLLASDANWSTSAWVRSWWNLPFSHTSMNRGPNRKPYETNLGSEIALWSYLAGALAIIIGLALLFKLDPDKWFGRSRQPWD